MVEDGFKMVEDGFKMVEDGLRCFKPQVWKIRNPHHTWPILAEKDIKHVTVSWVDSTSCTRAEKRSISGSMTSSAESIPGEKSTKHIMHQ